MSPPADRHFAVIPAAGVGARMGAGVPKQYLEIGGRTMLERSVAALLAARWIEAVVVVVAPDDARAAAALPDDPRVRRAPVGGATRRDSVLAGLEHAFERLGARGDDWALVHDAARPGLDAGSLERLRASLAGTAVGGLLALPVSDTVKRAAAGAPAPEVGQTVEREGLWLAQTPQMFRAGLLRDALRRHPEVTDEAAAIEAEGLAPRLVEGDRANFKVTTAGDLALMRRLLAGT